LLNNFGSYDGVHLGHDLILKRLVEISRDQGLRSLLITFSPHPQQVLAPRRAPKLLSITEEKIELVSQYGLDAMFIIQFNEEVARVTARRFMEEYLIGHFTLRRLVIGYNHAFGYQREGDVDFLKQNQEKYGFELTLIEPIICRGEPVHSSRIRKAMQHGDYNVSLELLGHDYIITGVVVRGKGVGKELGFPTINIKVPEEKLVPPAGVYAAYVVIDGDRFNGMMYIGEESREYALEVNLFDCQLDLYGKTVKVAPTRFIRRSARFAAQKDLIEQIKRDERKIRELFSIN
jgi:riboflavin kinase/FMN adenylyltransferase